MDTSPPKQPLQASQDPFARVKPAEHESAAEILKAYEQDKSAVKFNLMPGIFGEMSNRAHDFDITQKVQKEVIEANLDKDYVHMIGDADLNIETRKLIFGERLPSLGEKIVTVAAVSGSNAFRIIMEFFNSAVRKDVYLPNSGWESYSKICRKVGLKTRTYSYFDAKKKSADFQSICKSLKAAPVGSIVVLHGSAYNPTGVEPSVDQWKAIAKICKEKSLFAVIDSVGQGLVSGDVKKDNLSVETFLEQEVQVVVCQSLSSSMGIYGEKVGSLHAVCGSKEVAGKVLEQLKLIIRTMHANPPCNGEWIALRILNNPDNKTKWEAEIKQAAYRSHQLRRVIYDELKEFGEEGQWEYLVHQEGPFCHLEFSRKQRDLLRNRYHIYVSENGNINLENIDVKDANYVTEAFRSALAIPSSQF